MFLNRPVPLRVSLYIERDKNYVAAAVADTDMDMEYHDET
jgi:hypothetical protein